MCAFVVLEIENGALPRIGKCSISGVYPVS